jgi:hypothetical protein
MQFFQVFGIFHVGNIVANRLFDFTGEHASGSKSNFAWITLEMRYPIKIAIHQMTSLLRPTVCLAVRRFAPDTTISKT